LYVQLSFWILVAISIESISKRKLFIWLSRIHLVHLIILKQLKFRRSTIVLNKN
jgi:hypothetical protein